MVRRVVGEMTDDAERAMRREELLYRRELAVRTRRGVVQQRTRVRTVPDPWAAPADRDRSPSADAVDRVLHGA